MARRPCHSERRQPPAHDVALKREEATMRDAIVVEIDAPLEDVAELYFDPSNNARWMEDIERCEPVNGAQGKLGSIYRMLPKQGSLVFETRVVRRQFPHELEL